MRCETILPLLDDLADRSLPLATAWRVRRHIKNCAACQKAWTDAQAFGKEVRGLYGADSAAPSLALRVRTLQTATATATPAPVALRRRSLAGIGIAAFSGAAAAVAAIVALLWVTPGTPVRPTIAFAQVEAAMQQVKTVHWIERSRSSYRSGEPLGNPTIEEKWARLETPTLVEKRLPDITSTRQSTRINYFRSVTNAHERVMYDSLPNVVTITSSDQWGKKNGLDRGAMLRNRIVSETISPGDVTAYKHNIVVTAAAAAALKKTARFMPKPSPWKSRTVDLDGRELLLFERTTPQWKMPFSVNPPLVIGAAREQVWVEPNTHRVVRREQNSSFPNKQEVQYQVIAENFRYNETLPASTFVLVPPPGAKVVREEEHQGRPVWETLLAREKQKVQEVIAASDKGWKTGSFAAFASAWDFDYLHTLDPARDKGAVRRQQWAFRVLHQKTNWVQWHSKVSHAIKQNYINNRSFARGTPDILNVAVLVQGKPNGVGGQTWEGPATFYLRRTKTGAYKIIDWEWNQLWMAKALPSLLRQKGTR